MREFSELGIMSIGPDNVASLIYSAQTRCESCPANTYGVFTDTPKTNPDNYGEGESYERTSTCADCPAGRTSPPRSTSVDQCVLAPTHKMGRRAALARVGACDRGLTACLLTDDTWEWCVAKSRRSHCLKLTPYPVLPTASTLKTTLNHAVDVGLMAREKTARYFSEKMEKARSNAWPDRVKVSGGLMVMIEKRLTMMLSYNSHSHELIDCFGPWTFTFRGQ